MNIMYNQVFATGRFEKVNENNFFKLCIPFERP